MTLFILIWIALAAAAGGLAVGALWGRAIRKGSCAGSAGDGCGFATCAGCEPDGSAGHHASGSGG